MRTLLQNEESVVSGGNEETLGIILISTIVGAAIGGILGAEASQNSNAWVQQQTIGAGIKLGMLGGFATGVLLSTGEE